MSAILLNRLRKTRYLEAALDATKQFPVKKIII